MRVEKYWRRDKIGNVWREPPDYDADFVRIEKYNSAYSPDALIGELAEHLADVGIADWNGRGPYPLTVAEEVLKVLSHPSNRPYLLNLVQKIENNWRPNETTN